MCHLCMERYLQQEIHAWVWGILSRLHQRRVHSGKRYREEGGGKAEERSGKAEERTGKAEERKGKKEESH